MYVFNSRVRYSETDRDGRLTLGAVLDYFQDCSTFHSEELGLGMEYLKERHMVWVLSAWQVDALRWPELGEEIQIGTFPYAFKGFLGYRNFFLKDAEGNSLALANSIWTLLDTRSMRPVRPTQGMLEGYVLRERLPMEYAPRKIAMPKDGRILEEIVIKGHHIDSNHHVNNVQYVRLAMDYLPENYKISRMRAEYKKQARLHDTVLAAACRTKGLRAEDTYTVALCDKENQPYAVMEFSTGGQN